MSENRVRIHNHRDQPVELHVGGETVVLAPFAGVDLDARVADTPQVATLVQHRLLSVETLPEEPPPKAAAGRRKPARKPAGKPAKKPAEPRTAARKPKKPARRKKSP